MKNRSILLLFSLMVLFGGISPLKAQLAVIVNEPASIAGPLSFGTATGWGANLQDVAITEQARLMRDNTAADTLGCNLAVNAAELEGKIAVVYRGECQFSTKALRAQQAGAIALVVINNVTGGTIPMGAGEVAPQITIPVVMISLEDGAMIRPFLNNQTLVMFIGNKTGLFLNDLAFSSGDIVSANSFATPADFANNNNSFTIPVGAFVFNRGVAQQTNVRLNAKIRLGNNEIYNETSGFGVSLNSGDSLFIALPIFSQSAYQQGYYTIDYVISADSLDDFPGDNAQTANFMITENTYSKSRLEPDGTPINNGGIRLASGATFKWCIALLPPTGSSMQAKGITFATSTIAPKTLLLQNVQLELIEWLDESNLQFNNLNIVQDYIYDYFEDLQSQFVTANFFEPVFLEPGVKYLACATISADSMFLSVDNNVNYNTNYEVYDLPFFPVRTTSWFPGGFGPDVAPALILNLEKATSIAGSDDVLTSPAFPNPTRDIIQVPLKQNLVGSVHVEMYDMNGRLVKSQNIQNLSNMLILDTSDLSNGLYQMLIKHNSTQFQLKVVVSR